MPNQILATHMAREMGAQHILLPALTTTISMASMTPTVSIAFRTFSHYSPLSMRVLFPFAPECLSPHGC
jgi:hypothetical protein